MPIIHIWLLFYMLCISWLISMLYPSNSIHTCKRSGRHLMALEVDLVVFNAIISPLSTEIPLLTQWSVHHITSLAYKDELIQKVAQRSCISIWVWLSYDVYFLYKYCNFEHPNAQIGYQPFVRTTKKTSLVYMAMWMRNQYTCEDLMGWIDGWK